MKKLLILLPFFIIPIILPLYLFLDSNLFVKVFGCGCTTDHFNANDLRLLVFAVLATIAIFFGGFISRRFSNKRDIIKYNIYNVAFNLFYWYFAFRFFMWK